MSGAAVIAGRRDGAGWHVWLQADGGALALSPAKARQLAREIVAMADLIEFGWDADATEFAGPHSPAAADRGPHCPNGAAVDCGDAAGLGWSPHPAASPAFSAGRA